MPTVKGVSNAMKGKKRILAERTADNQTSEPESPKKPKTLPRDPACVPSERWRDSGVNTAVAGVVGRHLAASCDVLRNLGISAKEVHQLSLKFGAPEIVDSEEMSVSTVTSAAAARSSTRKKHDLGDIVVVDSTKSALASLCLTLASASPVLIQGPVGCGKTSIVREIAKNCGRVAPPRLFVIQISEQTDSRVLLGTYRCTDIPGQFVWQPGILTLAATKGAWLLLEDLDCGPSDVHSTLRPLLEWRKLFIPGRGDMVEAHKDFRVFATKRVSGKSSFFSGHGGQSSWANIEKLFVKIMVQPHPASELKEIVETRFPALKTVSSRLLSVYLLMSAETGLHVNDLEEAHNFGALSQKIASGRLFSTRDFMKWCERISPHFDGQSDACALRVFQEALECFCFSLPTMEKRLPVAEAIGARLNIPKAKVEFVLLVNKPSIHYPAGGSSMTVGRVTLPQMAVVNMDSVLKKEKAVYSLTKPAGRLLESVAACVARSEPVLLVGETGVGKTASVQFLARETGRRLTVVNINQQSDAMDLLGGYKPLEIKHTIRPVREEFEDLFYSTFDGEKNANFLHYVSSCFLAERWSDLVALMSHPIQPALQKVRKGQTPGSKKLVERWEKLDARLKHLSNQLKRLDKNASLAFAFVEGSLVRAVRNGDWILLDEINLATAETLDCLAGIIENFGGEGTVLLEAEDSVVKRHPDFRLFACMNPATDVGKRDLPPGIRNRFTEFFVEELTDSTDLKVLVGEYLRNKSVTMEQLDGIVKFYLAVRANAVNGKLRDGTGQRPHYSLRSLCRALAIARGNPCGNVLRSLFEAFSLAFLTQLDQESQVAVEKCVVRDILGQKNVKPILGRGLPRPAGAGDVAAVEVEGYWVTVGRDEPAEDSRYVLTPTVRANLRQLARIVSLSTLPVLLQGETSVGKTSLITHLARITGNRVVRVNNHEHTDVQEYLGSYAADEKTGKLVFREGAVVTAMRTGAWVILDELNLAPTEVLEALNRVLDDNREIFIPETQETVKAHPKFLLFATQNPPGGVYGGRKVLSRAFRNRFLELHFSQIPPAELEVILEQRSKVPLSYAKRMVGVMHDLQVRRRGSGVFFGKQGFMTLRDLFRWADRYRMADAELGTTKLYDWDQHLADEGYLLLGGRVRKEEERAVIRDVIAKRLKRSVDAEKLFTLSPETSLVTKPILEKLMAAKIPGFEHLVWTYDLRRLGVLAGQAAKFGEPVLLVGETGCGKTTVVQYLATLFGAELRTVNCHMHSESADFLGGLRPVRVYSEADVRLDVEDGEEEQEKKTPGKLFEWVEGPLVAAMRRGEYFLADEISLADDSVLERLNSVLEPERKLFVAERGGSSETDMSVVAAPDFRIFGTMNPGGDYGKKELSPALRNRFTEIWAEQVHCPEDMANIMEANLRIGDRTLASFVEKSKSGVGGAAVEFLEYFKSFSVTSRCVVSARDILALVHFVNRYCSLFPDDEHALPLGYVHGVLMVFIDGLGSGPTAAANSKLINQVKEECLQFLIRQVSCEAMDSSWFQFERYSLETDVESRLLRLGPFAIALGPKKHRRTPKGFSFEASTPKLNAGRLLRALQVGKPVLMEGSPGVGKTSLVQALAAVSGHHVVRINLSDQTDISDLFGADLPVEGGRAGEFAWRDGPLLQALRRGHWILLDELNLASQSVLEGLNACLDHRGEIYVPELGKTFRVAKKDLRLFACQNPTPEGGARKGLPKSFLNRFTQVFMEPLMREDLVSIFRKSYPALPSELAEKMIEFNASVGKISCGRGGSRTTSAWEWNLRDLSRWAEFASRFSSSSSSAVDSVAVSLAFNAVYLARLDSAETASAVVDLFRSVMGSLCDFVPFSGSFRASGRDVRVGRTVVARCGDGASLAHVERDGGGEFGRGRLRLLRGQLRPLETLLACVEMNWVSIVVGGSGSGKTSLVRVVAALCGRNLRQMSLSSAMDTTELLGGFEQADLGRSLDVLASEIDARWKKALKWDLLNFEGNGKAKEQYRKWAEEADKCWNTFKALAQLDEIGREKSSDDEIDWFRRKCEALVRCVDCGLRKANGKPIFVVADANADARSGDAATATATLTADELKERILDLAARAVADGSLSGGGRFEWIDSTLVQAMRVGDWVLLDNVNLCSPSVLDRLNGVLEPGGVLVMTERGVIDGDIPAVKPHDNFRLFLTMDPRFGEISRAMRNRGCEVFLASGGAESSSSTSTSAAPTAATSDEMDVKAILIGLGLGSHETQCRLFGLHRALLSKIPFYAKPTQFDLIHAAALTGQQLKFGIPVEKALSKSCKDVYLNAVSGLCDAALTKTVNETIEEWLAMPVPDSGWVLSPDVCPTLRDIHFRPDFACVKREALALELVIQAFGRGDTIQFSEHDLLGDRDVRQALKIVSEPAAFVLPALKAFLMRTTTASKLADVRTVLARLDALADRRRLDRAAQVPPLADLLDAFSLTLAKMVAWRLVGAGDDDDNGGGGLLHFDPRWEPEDVLLGAVPGNGEKELALEKLQAAVELFCCSEVGKDFESDLELSGKHARKGTFLSSVKHAAAPHLDASVKKILSSLKTFLSSPPKFASPSDREPSQQTGVHGIVANGLFYLKLFCHLLHGSPDRLGIPKATKFVIPLLKVHWMWLLKFLIRPLKRLDPTLKLPVVDKVSDLLGIDDAGLQREREARKFRNRFGHPELFACDEDGKFVDAKIEAAKKLRPFPAPTNPAALAPWTARLTALSADECGGALAAICNNDCREPNFEALEVLAAFTDMNSEEFKTAPEGFHFKIQLWPLLEALVSMERMVTQEDVEGCGTVWSPDRLLTVAWPQSTATAVSSGVFNSGLEAWVKWRPWDATRQAELDGLREADLKHKVVFGPHGGVITYCVNMILCPPPERFPAKATDKAQYSPVANNLPAEVTLGQCQSKAGQLETLAHALWRNAAEISDRAKRSRSLEADTCLRRASKILSAVGPQTSADAGGSVGSKSTTVQFGGNLVKDLEEKSESLRVVGQNLDESQHLDRVALDGHIGDLWISVALAQIHLAFPGGSIDPLVKKNIKAAYNRMQREEAEKELEIHRWVAFATAATELDCSGPNAHPVLKRLASICAKITPAVDDAVRPEHSDFYTLANEIASFVETLASVSAVTALRKKLTELRHDVSRALGAARGGKPDRRGFGSKLTAVAGQVGAWKKSQLAFAQRLSDTYAWFPDLAFVFYTGALQLVKGVDLLLESAQSMHATLVLSTPGGVPVDGPWSAMSLGGPLVPTVRGADDVSRGINAVDMAMQLVGGGSEDTRTGNRWLGSYAKSCLLKSFFRETSSRVLCLGVHGFNHFETGRARVQAFDACCKIFVADWAEEQRRLEKAKAEREALFHYKTHAEELDEAKQTEAELKEMFPEFEDFSDMRDRETGAVTTEASFSAGAVEEKMDVDSEGYDDGDGTRCWPMSDDEALFVQTLHKEIFRLGNLPWLCADERSSVDLDDKSDRLWTEAHVERMRACAATLPKLHRLLDCSEDSKLLGALAVNAALRKSLIPEDDQNSSMGGDDWGRPYDFYRDANLEEARMCLPLLENLKRRADVLLEDWPDHATLKQLKEICDRIAGFSVRSPLIRFVNGLEMILVAAQHWEEFAHSKISLMEELQAVTKLVIRYRKLELDSWKRSLDAVGYRARVSASRWWFHLHSLVEDVASDHWKPERDPRGALGVVCRDLMEQSPIGEFCARLDLLLTFHCHVSWLSSSSGINAAKAERLTLAAKVLWNLHQFYAQLAPRIQDRLVAVRKPIEKELREFVKISRWNDLNFYALKHAVDKSHRTLHKKIKQYQKVLAEPVGPYMTDAALVSNEWLGPMDPRSDEEKVDASAAKRKSKKTMAPRPSGPIFQPAVELFLSVPLSGFGQRDEQVESAEKNRILQSLEIPVSNLGPKVAKLCKKIMAESKCGPQLVEINDFCATIIEVAAELGKLEVNETDKEKRKKQVRHLHQVKSRALTDLFKQLARSGLSHRLGLSHESCANEAGQADVDEWVDLEPVDLEARVAQVENWTSDAALKSVWSGVTPYVFKSAKRMELMRSALDSPTECTKQLGAGVLPRFRGIVAHLKRLVYDDAKSVAGLESQVFDIRRQMTALHRVLEVPEDGIPSVPPQKQLLDRKNAWHEILVELVLELKRIECALDAVPSSAAEPLSHCFLANKAAGNPEIQLSPSSPTRPGRQPLFDAARGGPALLACRTRLNAVTSGVRDAAARLGRNSAARTDGGLVTAVDAAALHSIGADLSRNVIPGLDSLAAEFGDSALVGDLVGLTEKLRRVLTEEPSRRKSSSDFADVEAKLAAVLKEVMLGVQESYKRTVVVVAESEEPSSEEKPAGGTKSDDERLTDFEDAAVTKRLGVDLKCFEENLRLARVADGLKEFKASVAEAAERGAGEELYFKLRALVDLLEPIDRYIALANFHLHQRVGSLRTKAKLLSILSGLFSQLVVKGFCLPAEELEEAKSGPSDMPTKFQDLEDAGLGDGEGTKDVSDKIESEDMLEDAKRPEDYEKDDANEDLQQEEGGIEMSDDFKGKMQDVDKGEKEEDEGEGKDEEEEEDLEKQMGDIEEGADKLDDQIWGDDEEDQPEEDEEKGPEKEERGKSSGKQGDDETVAKDPNVASDDEEDRDENGEEEGKGDEKKGKPKEPNLDDEEVDDDHEDPYHANPPEYPEPEDFDMPDDAGGEGDQKEGDEGLPDDEDDKMDEENPFDLDKLKDKQRQEEEEKEGEEGEEGKTEGLTGDEDKDGEEGKEEEEKEAGDGADGEEEKEQEAEEGEKKGEDREIAELGQPEDQEKERNEEEKSKKDDEEQQTGEDKALNSKDDPGQPAAQPAPSDAKGGSLDDVLPQEAEMDQNAEEQLGQHDKEGKEEKEGVGASEMERGSGHRAQNQAARVKREAEENKEPSADEPEKKKRKPGKIDDKRTLGSEEETVRKDLMNLRDDSSKTRGEEDQSQEEEDEGNADISEGYEHVEKEEEGKGDGQVVDAATDEQALEKPAPTNKEVNEEQPENLEDDVVMAEEVEEPEAAEKLRQDKSSEQNPKPKSKRDADDVSGKNKTTEQNEDREAIETPGDVVLTLGAARGPETDAWTREELVHGDPDKLDAVKLKHLLADEAHKWHQRDETKGEEEELEAEKAWRTLENEIGPLAQSLCEQLRLILEPSLAARLQGDFRSGKRLNMRKIIPYVASGFRKDRIWLRRVKPWKRHHRVVIAVDDSASMKLAGASAMAQASLALIAKSLSLLGLGENQLSVMSFGDKVRVLHPFADTFSDVSGAKILREFSFEQTKTHISALLDAATAVFVEAGGRNPAVAAAETAQLLVIVSDGRGLFCEGSDKVDAAVRQARDANIFVVFVVVDNPENKDSILDVRQPQFGSDGSLLGIRSYMENFPFPFYVILRDIDALPSVLGDALRQWFELVTAPKT